MADKRDLLLTLVFLHFIDEKFVAQTEVIKQECVTQGYTAEQTQILLDAPSSYEKASVFYVPTNCRWNIITTLPADKSLPTRLDGIVKALEDTTDTLRGTLPTNIFTSSQITPNILKQVIDEVSKITSARFPEADLIGHVYEYFLQAFAFQLKDNKEEGEFYTPYSIVNLIAHLIEPIDGTIYDPCCGSGGMFVQSMKVIQSFGKDPKRVMMYGQEMQPETWRLAKMNLAVRGIINQDLGKKPASTFTDDQHPNKKMDYIITNPPFNLKKWREENQLHNDPRWTGYEVPPISNANYAWVLHILYKLNPQRGIAGFLLANGALSDSDTIAIRKQLIENDKVEAIIVLPRDMFYSTDISVTLWILNQNKYGGEWHERQLRNRTEEILFMDLRTWTQNIYEKSYVQFSQEQIDEVCDIYHRWQMVGIDGKRYERPELYRSVGKEEIVKNEYSLVPSRYIQFIDRDRDLDTNTILKQSFSNINDLIIQSARVGKTLQEAMKVLERRWTV